MGCLAVVALLAGCLSVGAVVYVWLTPRTSNANMTVSPRMAGLFGIALVVIFGLVTAWLARLLRRAAGR